MSSKAWTFFNPGELYKEPVTVFDNYGLLEGLRGEVKDICRQNYLTMAKFMYENDLNTFVAGFEFGSFIYPVIRRVTVECPLLIEDPQKFWDYMCEYIKENMDHYQNVVNKSSHRIDLESYACRDLADSIIDILKSDPCDTTTQ